MKYDQTSVWDKDDKAATEPLYEAHPAELLEDALRLGIQVAVWAHAS